MQLRLGNDQGAELGMNVTGNDARKTKSLTQRSYMNGCGSSQGKQEAQLIRHGANQDRWRGSS